MKLSLLTDAIDSVLDATYERSRLPGGLDPEVASIQYRSDKVTPGGLFVAVRGQRTDGHRYVSDAIARGAVAVIVEQEVSTDSNISVIRVRDARKALALAAARFYDTPSDKLVMIGITGTNGKTTIAYLIEQILDHENIPTGVIGTINYRYDGKTFDNPLTTPEALELQQILAEMVAAGVTHVVMEVSSHGIELDRLRGCLFDIAVFTNLTQDHLDFHHDMAAYWKAKKRLFTEYLHPKTAKGKPCAVINVKDQKGHELAAMINHCPVIRVGKDPKCAVFPENTGFDETGIQAEIQTTDGSFSISSKLVGRFNLENILCAAGVGIALGLPLDGIKTGIDTFSTIPGRLERISDVSGRFVFVDYAHTPNALENVLETLREVNAGRLVCVFGCGGDRDTDKRPKMGEIAGRLSDLVIITSDNPRTEPPLKIIEAIRIGTHRVVPRQLSAEELEGGWSSPAYVVEPDRQKAIYLGIQAAKPGDTVLIAGKGHETYQIVGTEILPFDDRKIAEQGLSLN